MNFSRDGFLGIVIMAGEVDDTMEDYLYYDNKLKIMKVSFHAVLYIYCHSTEWNFVIFVIGWNMEKIWARKLTVKTVFANVLDINDTALQS